MKIVLQMIGAVLLVFTICFVSSAATDKCTVVEVGNNQMVLKCAKKTGDFQVDDRIKIKSVKPKSVEGR